ncbi:hypothetical protein U9Z90_20355, partial [Escherichia fergusonii]
SFELELRGKCAFSPTSFDHTSPHIHCFNINRILRCPELPLHYKPLRAAKIEVQDVEGEPGWYKVALAVRPHFKYMGATFELALVGRLDKE